MGQAQEIDEEGDAKKRELEQQRQMHQQNMRIKLPELKCRCGKVRCGQTHGFNSVEDNGESEKTLEPTGTISLKEVL